MRSAILFIGLLGTSGVSLAIEMPQDAKEIGCPKCHAIDHKVVGPAWTDVSRRYRDSRDSKVVFDALVSKVSKGGFGNWGDTPMAANDPTGANHDKIVGLVRFILSLSDQPPASRPK